VRLHADQSSIVWAPWRDDEGADETAEKSLPLARITCVSAGKVRRCARPRLLACVTH
jgi:hypothetical protein